MQHLLYHFIQRRLIKPRPALDVSYRKMLIECFVSFSSSYEVVIYLSVLLNYFQMFQLQMKIVPTDILLKSTYMCGKFVYFNLSSHHFSPRPVKIQYLCECTTGHSKTCKVFNFLRITINYSVNFLVLLCTFI